ncbi:MAG: type IV pilus secretin PilQ [Syntrophales bacterium]|nr:type IV pilus secretin PilQ [Syntrophales bacterium]
MNNGEHRAIFRWMIGVLIGVWSVAGCGGDTIVKKDPFFEKWKTLEQTSTGSSPVATPRIIDARDTVPKSRTSQFEEKPIASVRLLPTTEISLKMIKEDVKPILRSMARIAGLNILIKNDVKGEISIDFKNVAWDQAFNSILRTYGLTYLWEGDILRVLSLEDKERDFKQKTQEMNARLVEDLLPPEVVPIEYGNPQEIMDNLKDMLAKDKDGKPKGSIKVDKHSNSLIIQTVADNLQSMLSIIEKLDKPTHQILIKANIVEATKDTARNLGVQWGGMYAGQVGRRDIFITPGGTAGSATTPSALSGAYTPTYGATGIAGQGNAVNFPASSAAMAAAGGTGSLGLLFGTIGGNILEVQLQALQKDGKINILSSPSITTLDNQMAYTENGEKVPYVSTSTAAGATTQDVKFEYAVLRLEITPHVIGEKNLKMAILIKKNEVDPTGRNVLGNPYIFKKETKTNLIVQDGETIVISGLTKQKSTESEGGVPWLKDIPGLGWLFKATGKAESMEEVLIFITPTILPPQVATAAKPAGAKPVETGK